eukprot:98228_1
MSSVYNNSELHIFGSEHIINTSNQTTYIYTFDLYPQLQFKTALSIHPEMMHASSFSCRDHNRCYDTINDTVYAFIATDNNDNIFLYKYNMLTKSFYNKTQYINSINQISSQMEYERAKYYIDGCIVSDGKRYIYSFGTTAGYGRKYHGFQYDAILDIFILREFNSFSTGYSMGCNIDIYKQNIYIFGGTYYNGFEVNTIEKWNIQNDIWTVINNAMTYSRSEFTVLVTEVNHFIIIGGTTFVSQQHIEIFDGNTDEMIFILSINNIHLLNIQQLNPFIFNKLLYISSNDTVVTPVMYVNLTEIVCNDTYATSFVVNDSVLNGNVYVSSNEIYKWQQLAINLPESITGHISVIYEDKLHIIGGYINGSVPSYFSYVSIDSMSSIFNNRNNINNISKINEFYFKINSQIMPNWNIPNESLYDDVVLEASIAPNAITCKYQCYTQIEEMLYIQLHNEQKRNIFYVIYNLSSASFHLPEYYENYLWNVGELRKLDESGKYTLYTDWTVWPSAYIDQCVLTTNTYTINNTEYIRSYGGNVERFVLFYNTKTRDWTYPDSTQKLEQASTFDKQLNNRFAMGCISKNQIVYFFGGIFYYGGEYETDIITKLNIETNDLYRLETRMQYKRSHFKISSIYISDKEYFIIYGGITDEANANIEIFDPATEQMVIFDTETDRNPIKDIRSESSEINRSLYSSFIYNNHLFISGGFVQNGNQDIAVNNFKYLNLENLFNLELPFSQQSNDSCKNIYYTNLYNRYTGDIPKQVVDKYIYQYTGQIMFDVFTQESTNQTAGAIMEIIGSPQDLKYWFLLPDPICPPNIPECVSLELQTSTSVGRYDIFIDNREELDPDDVHMFWVKWDAYFNVGIGNQYGLDPFKMNNYYVVAGVNGIQIDTQNPSKWIFYHNECGLQIDVTLNATNEANLFAVGDNLYIEWELIKGHSLNRVIMIQSQDIININHRLITNENDECIVWSVASTSNSSCDEGIQILELDTYDIEKQNYTINFIAAHPILLESNDTSMKFYNKSFTFERDIMQMDISLRNADELYPQSTIYFDWKIIQPIPTQPNGVIIMSFDKNLQVFNDDQTTKLNISFYDNSCHNDIIDCSANGIKLEIPSNMWLKPITDPIYMITMYSNDVILTSRSMSHTLIRKFQQLFVQVSSSTYLGGSIMINLTVYPINDKIYQPTSQLSIKSSDLDFDILINIQYDKNNGNIASCQIVQPLTQRIDNCDKGITFKQVNKEMIGQNYSIIVDSTDTYIFPDIIRTIHIDNCPIGQGLIESSNSTNPCIVCDDNKINIYKNSKCSDCTDIEGIECRGSSQLIISFNYWVSINALSSKNETFYSSYCPPGFCCTNNDGCLTNNSDSSFSNLCAKNRNASVPLCGECNQGFAEVFGSTNCRRCQKNYYEYLLIPMFFATIYVLFLTHFNTGHSKTTDDAHANKTEINYKNLFLKDDIEAIKISILRPMLYLYQAISITTIQHPLLDVFSMQFIIDNSSAANNNNEGICFTKTLTVFQKELWQLFFPVSMFIILLFYYIIIVYYLWF